MSDKCQTHIETCQASGCSEKPKDEDHLMCMRHWRLVPRHLKNILWWQFRRLFRSSITGEKAELEPEPDLDWAQAAVGAVAILEHRSISAYQAKQLELAGYSVEGLNRGILHVHIARNI